MANNRRRTAAQAPHIKDISAADPSPQRFE